MKPHKRDVRHRRSQRSDNEENINSTTAPTTSSKPLTTCGMNNRLEQKASTQPSNKTIEESSTTTALSTSSPSLKSDAIVSRNDYGNEITKSAAKKDLLCQEASHLAEISDTKRGDKDSASNLKDTDTIEDTKMDVVEQAENLLDMKNEEIQAEKLTKMDMIEAEKDPVKDAQSKKHKDTVTVRAQEGNTTVEEENDLLSEESHKQHGRYYKGGHPISRPETERKYYSDLTQQDSVLEERTATSVERKRKDGDKKDTTTGIGFEHVMVCACVLFCAILTNSVSNANQEIKELKERLDKMQKSYDSLSLENIQNIIKREVKIFKKDVDELKDSLKSENGNLRKDLTYEVGQSRNMMEAAVNRLKTQHESQGQIMKELTRASRELKSKMEEQSGKVLDLGTDIGHIQTHVAAHGQAVGTLDRMHKALAENLEKHGLVMGAMQSQLDSYQREIQRNSVEILARITKADADLHKFEEQMSKTSERLQQHDKELYTAFDNLFNKKKAIDALNEKQESMNTNLKTNEKAVKDLQSKLKTYPIEKQEKSVEILVRMEKALEDLQGFEAYMSDTSNKLQQHDRELDMAFDNLLNKKVMIVVITIMVCVNIGLIFAMYVLCQCLTKAHSLEGQRAN